MFGTLISLLGALYLVFYQPQEESTAWISVLYGMLAISILFFILHMVLQASFITPLAQAEKSSTPRIIDLYRKDRTFKFSHLFFTLFPLVSYLFLLAALFTNGSDQYFVAVWIVLFGIAIDLLRHSIGHFLKYLNPFSVVSMFTKTAKSDVQEDREMELCDSIDALSELATKSLETSGTGLPIKALDEMQIIARNFFNSVKSIAHRTKDPESEKMGISDRISYTLFFLLQRLEHIETKALEKNLEPVCSSVITTLGKIAIHAAKFDVSLCGYPIHVLGRCAEKAQMNGMSDVAAKAVITLVEVAKAIIQEIDVTYLELKEPFAILITEMHNLTKEAFRQNKEMDIELFRQPFRQVKELFTTERMATHQDTPEILARLDQVIAEWDALELVLKTIPPIPSLGETPPPA